MKSVAVTDGVQSREAYSYRQDPAVPAFPDAHPIIIFDGLCAFCSSWARFVLRHDRTGKYRLLAAQSPLGQAIYQHYGLNSGDYETNILIEDGVAWFKSEGSLRMCEGLGFPWSLARGLRLLPQGLRDRGYTVIARNRLRIFGKRETCFIPSPEFKGRFLG